MAPRPARTVVGSTATEKRAPGGRVTEIEVRSGASTYYLKPQFTPGSAAPGNAQSGSLRTPQWNVLNFDLPTARSSDRRANGPESTPVPPPPRTN
jgi:hypothetical protein